MDIPKCFIDFWHRESLWIVKISVAFALCSSIVFGFFDQYYLDRAERFAFWFRALVMIPGCLIALTLMFSKWNKVIYPVLAGLCVVINIGFAIGFVIEGQGFSIVMLFATIQTLLFLYFLFKVPFWTALPAGIVILVSFLLPQFMVQESIVVAGKYSALGLIGGSMLTYFSYTRNQEMRRLHQILLEHQDANIELIEQKAIRLNTLNDITRYLRHEISGFLDVAQMALVEPPDEEQLMRARQSLRSITNVLESASDAASLSQALKIETKTLCDFESIVSMALKRFAEQTIDVDLEEEVFVSGNAIRLAQLVNALVENAVSFSPSEHMVGVTLRRTTEGATLIVDNHGPPLAESTARLFDHGFSMREANGENTHHLGLGLFVAKTVADGHDGTISATHADGITKFIVTLPLVKHRDQG